MEARYSSVTASLWRGRLRQAHGRHATAIALALAFSLAITAAPAQAASGSIINWNTFRGPGDDAFQAVLPAPGGVYAAGYTVGSSYDVVIYKNSAANLTLGSRYWDGPQEGSDSGYDMATDHYGEVVVCGSTQGISVGDRDLMVLKLTAASQPLWAAVLDGGAFGDDCASDVCCDGYGNVYVTGWYGDATGYRYWTLKLDAADGGIVWQVTYSNGGGRDMATAICLDGQGNVYVTGSSRNTAADAGRGSTDVATVKYDGNGVQQWVVRSDGPRHGGDNANDIALGCSGTLFVAGSTDGRPDSSRTDANILLVRLSTGGTQTWLRTLDDTSHWSNLGLALRVGKSNSPYVAGTMWNKANTRSKGIVARWRSSGTLMWGRIWGSSGGRSAAFNDVVIDGAGTAWCAGFMTSAHPGNDQEGLVCKYTAGGRNLWASGWEGPGRRDDGFSAITLLGSRWLFAAGSSVYPGRGLDGAIVKYVR